MNDYVSAHEDEGPQRYCRQLVVVKHTRRYNFEQVEILETARGAQWRYPETPLQCKKAARINSLLTLQQGGGGQQDMGTSGTERILRLLADQREGHREGCKVAHFSREYIQQGPIEGKEENVEYANIGQVTAIHKTMVI